MREALGCRSCDEKWVDRNDLDWVVDEICEVKMRFEGSRPLGRY